MRKLSLILVMMLFLAASANAIPPMPNTGAQKYVAKSATGTLSSSDCTNSTIVIYGQTGNITLTLPPAFKGGSFTVIIGQTAAYYLRLDPNGSEVQSLNGVDLGAGKYIGVSSMTKGNSITYKAIQTGASTYQWAAFSVTGTWTVEA